VGLDVLQRIALDDAEVRQLAGSIVPSASPMCIACAALMVAILMAPLAESPRGRTPAVRGAYRSRRGLASLDPAPRAHHAFGIDVAGRDGGRDAVGEKDDRVDRVLVDTPFAEQVHGA
jgi:hypothetical protein